MIGYDMAYDIVTDSSANLTEAMYDELGITVLPLRFIHDGEETVSYCKGKQTDLKVFFEQMREGTVFTTSLPNSADSEQAIREILDAGRDVLYIGFSSGLSGTYESTRLIMDELAAEYPDRKLIHIDTLAAAGGEGLIVYLAAQKRIAGASIEEVAQWVENNKFKVGHWFTVDDLMFLFRGGRVSKTSAWAGTLLNIKPVLNVDDEGHLIPRLKVRGRKKSLDALCSQMEKFATESVEDQTIFICHGDCQEDAEYLAERIQKRLNPGKIVINYLDPVIGAHAGPGTVALFFLASARQ